MSRRAAWAGALVTLLAGCAGKPPYQFPGFAPSGAVLIREAGIVAPKQAGSLELERAWRPADVACCAMLRYREGAVGGSSVSLTIRPRIADASSLGRELAFAQRRVTRTDEPQSATFLAKEVLVLGASVQAGWVRSEQGRTRGGCGIDVLIAPIDPFVVEARHWCPTDQSREAILHLIAALERAPSEWHGEVVAE